MSKIERGDRNLAMLYWVRTAQALRCIGIGDDMVEASR